MTIQAIFYLELLNDQQDCPAWPNPLAVMVRAWCTIKITVLKTVISLWALRSG
jgi:hypothetical protein